jgi:hypothetical protein
VHAVAHAPHVALVERSASHPSAAMPSQSARPLSHVSVQSPAWQRLSPFGSGPHVTPQRPQFAPSVSRSNPSSTTPSQSLSTRSQTSAPLGTHGGASKPASRGGIASIPPPSRKPEQTPPTHTTPGGHVTSTHSATRSMRTVTSPPDTNMARVSAEIRRAPASVPVTVMVTISLS